MVFCRWLWIVCLALPTAASAQSAPTWPDTFESRVQALAVIQTLNAAILSSRSATATLEQWCRDHELADDPTIVADVVRDAETPASAEQRSRLQITEQEPVKYRRVELRCGTRVLSKAEIWYVPAKLTAEMNRLLETTSTPFGRVVQSLQPSRQTFGATLLWSPLPDGWETRATAWPKPTGRLLVIPDAIFAHRALLYTGEHAPFAEVNEVYQRQILAFRPPRRAQ
jgi:chorismate-pyruvate lyase